MTDPGEAQALLCDLMKWRPPQDLRPLIQRTSSLCGPRLLVDLPTSPPLAREKLIDAVEDYLGG